MLQVKFKLRQELSKARSHLGEPLRDRAKIGREIWHFRAIIHAISEIT